MATTAETVLEIRAKINESGRVVIPIQLREAFDIKPGDEIIFSLDGETIRIETQLQRARRAQAMITKLIGPGRSLADELIAERREEFRKEMVE
jgi:AbrB family looped-hinge helix DNA binding protein